MKQPVNLPKLKLIILNNTGTKDPMKVKNATIGKVAVAAARDIASMTLLANCLKDEEIKSIYSSLLYADGPIEPDYEGLDVVDKAAEGVDTLVVIANSNFLGTLKAWISITMEIPLPPGIPPGSGSSIAINVKEKTFTVI